MNRQPAWKKKNKAPNFPREHKIGPLEVEVKNNDVIQAFRLLEKKMIKEGVLSTLKRKRYAEKPSEKKRRKYREALKKMRRVMSKMKRNRGFGE